MDIRHIDAVGFLNSRNIPYYTEGKNIRSGWIGLQCPFCDDPSNHLGIHEESNTISCWRCKTKGSFTKYVMKIFHLPFDATIKLLENFKRTYIISQQENFVRTSDRCIYPKKLNTFPPIHWKIQEFLNDRGISQGNFLRHACGYTNLYHEYPCRIFFPITYNYRTVSFVMRDFSGLAEKRYVNWPENMSEIPAKEMLYGYDEAPENSTLVLVEGVLDKLKLGKRALATLGVQVTKSQVLHILYKNPKKLFILFDSEKEAQKIADDLAHQIWFCPTEVIQLNNYKDPGELTEVDGAKLMNMLI